MTAERFYDVQEVLHLKGGGHVSHTVTTVAKPLDVDQLTGFLVELARKIAGQTGEADDPIVAAGQIPLYSQQGLITVPRVNVLYGKIVQVDRLGGMVVPVDDAAVAG